MAELTKALCKFKRAEKVPTGDIIENVQEEIADVFIMVEQMKIAFDKTKVDKAYTQKLYRLAYRLNQADDELCECVHGAEVTE